MAFKVLAGMAQCLQRRVFLFPTLKVYSQICRDKQIYPVISKRNCTFIWFIYCIFKQITSYFVSLLISSKYPTYRVTVSELIHVKHLDLCLACSVSH